jgi:WXG100 family type VII secretion target
MGDDFGMPQFSVDSERVMAANGTIQATIGRLKSEVDTLHTQLIALQDSWQGQASTSFQELVVRWRTTSDSVDAQLAELGSALAYAAQQYSEIEQANQRLFL